jgi:hypothetical protein
MANVLANTARAIATNRLKSSGTEPNNVGWGTGAGTAAVTDTTLFTEKALDLTTGTGTRVAGTSTQQTTSTTNDTYQVAATLTASAPGTVTNAGLFDSSTITAGNLYAKADFTGIVLASGDSITFTFKAQYS